MFVKDLSSMRESFYSFAYRENDMSCLRRSDKIILTIKKNYLLLFVGYDEMFLVMLFISMLEFELPQSYRTS